MLEGMSLRHALQLVERYRLKTKWVECGNQPIVQMINVMVPADMYARQVAQDIKRLMTRVDATECRYISRQSQSGGT